MVKHLFELILPDVKDLSDELQDTIDKAGCDDAILAMKNGVVRLYFTREAEDYQTAVRSAMTALEKVGYTTRLMEMRS